MYLIKKKLKLLKDKIKMLLIIKIYEFIKNLKL